MPFIDTIPESEIGADVRAMYERQQSFWGFVPNYAKVFCWRPEIMGLWAQLQAGIKRNMDKRRFELVTFAAAHTLRSTLCTLAHGRTLTTWFSVEDVQLMARGASPASLTVAEAAMMSFSRKVARGAFLISAHDVHELKTHGFTDAEVFDIAATVAARAFFTTLNEALGVEPEPPFLQLEPEFRKTLTVGRAHVA
jgi:alkylhydroperoxidase family enzyme